MDYVKLFAGIEGTMYNTLPGICKDTDGKTIREIISSCRGELARITLKLDVYANAFIKPSSIQMVGPMLDKELGYLNIMKYKYLFSTNKMKLDMDTIYASACAAGHTDIVALLHDVMRPNIVGLVHAILEGHMDITQLIMSCPQIAYSNYPDSNFHTMPNKYAFSIVERILEKHTDVLKLNVIPGANIVSVGVNIDSLRDIVHQCDFTMYHSITDVRRPPFLLSDDDLKDMQNHDANDPRRHPKYRSDHVYNGEPDYFDDTKEVDSINRLSLEMQKNYRARNELAREINEIEAVDRFSDPFSIADSLDLLDPLDPPDPSDPPDDVDIVKLGNDVVHPDD